MAAPSKTVLTNAPYTNNEDPEEHKATERKIVPPGHNARLARDLQQVQILEAWEAEDLGRVDQLCREALPNPFLPRMHRTQYNPYMSFCPGRSPTLYLKKAAEIVEEMAALAESEGVGPDICRDIDFWKQHIDRLLSKVVPNPELEDVVGPELKEEVAQTEVAPGNRRGSSRRLQDHL